MTDTNTQAQVQDASTPPVDPAQKYVERAEQELPAGTESQYTTQQKVALGVFLISTRQAAEYFNQTQWDFDEVARHYRLAVDSGNPERIAATKAAFEKFVISVVGGTPDKSRVGDTEYRTARGAVARDVQKIVMDHYTGRGGAEEATEAQLAEAPRLLLDGPAKTIARYLNTSWDKDFVDAPLDPIDALLKGLLNGQRSDNGRGEPGTLH